MRPKIQWCARHLPPKAQNDVRCGAAVRAKLAASTRERPHLRRARPPNSDRARWQLAPTHYGSQWWRRVWVWVEYLFLHSDVPRPQPELGCEQRTHRRDAQPRNAERGAKAKTPRGAKNREAGAERRRGENERRGGDNAACGAGACSGQPSTGGNANEGLRAFPPSRPVL